MRLLLTGKMGSGKSSVSTYLVGTYGASRWTRSELMKRLAHAAVDGVGDVDACLEAVFPDEEECAVVRREVLAYAARYEPETGKQRRLYQDVAEICQQHDPLCFEMELDERIQASTSDDDFALVDDVRKLEGFEYFRDQGYTTVRIDANEEVRRARMLRRDGYLPSEETFAHPSETDLDDVPHDHVVDNDSDDPTVLHEQLDALMHRLGISPRDHAR